MFFLGLYSTCFEAMRQQNESYLLYFDQFVFTIYLPEGLILLDASWNLYILSEYATISAG
jgi:uncharacterized protein YllA (UPF0747 family)